MLRSGNEMSADSTELKMESIKFEEMLTSETNRAAMGALGTWPGAYSLLHQ